MYFKFDLSNNEFKLLQEIKYELLNNHWNELRNILIILTVIEFEKRIIKHAREWFCRHTYLNLIFTCSYIV